MTFKQLDFNATNIDFTGVETRLAAHHGNQMSVSELEYHEVTTGPAITGTLTWESGACSIGLWNSNGTPFFADTPALEQWGEVREPDLRIGYINLYRATQNQVGFTCGSRISHDEADMKARGLRNDRGNYLGTVKIEFDINTL